MTEVTMTHPAGCPADRIDITHHEAEQITTYHCLDCGCHVAVNADGSIRPNPTETGPFADAVQGASWTASMTNTDTHGPANRNPAYAGGKFPTRAH